MIISLIALSCRIILEFVTSLICGKWEMPVSTLTEHSNGEDDEGLAVFVKAGCCSFIHAGN